MSATDLALFLLIPLNTRAEKVVTHESNKNLVSTFMGQKVLNIGGFRSKSGPTTLAVLGRGVASDIMVAGGVISKVQCSFELNTDTNVVLFYDRSHYQSSQVLALPGDEAFPFEFHRPRKVVVHAGVNSVIGMGGEKRNLVMFRLKWNLGAVELMAEVKRRRDGAIPLLENSSLAQTPDTEDDTAQPSRYQTRIHSRGPQQPRLRHAFIAHLGEGQFGTVMKAVDVDSGQLLAVKSLKRPAGISDEEWMKNIRGPLKREVEILSDISHENIVDYIGSEGWDGDTIKIFMGLKDGTVASLVEKGCSLPITDLVEAVLQDMLRALDFLDSHGIVHRDVKPENILYEERAGRWIFQLGDFGLSNRQNIATSHVGTPLYMAPEMPKNVVKTGKADVWSLYVTLLWTVNHMGFRTESAKFRSVEEVQRAVTAIASDGGKIREMAKVNPEERASAGQMLVKCFDGAGLTTPRNRVPPLPNIVPPLPNIAPPLPNPFLPLPLGQPLPNIVPPRPDIIPPPPSFIRPPPNTPNPIPPRPRSSFVPAPPNTPNPIPPRPRSSFVPAPPNTPNVIPPRPNLVGRPPAPANAFWTRQPVPALAPPGAAARPRLPNAGATPSSQQHGAELQIPRPAPPRRGEPTGPTGGLPLRTPTSRPPSPEAGVLGPWGFPGGFWWT